MKKLFTFKNLLGVIFIIVLIIVPLVTKDKETINIFYFFVGIIFILTFYRIKDDSNSCLIHIYEKKDEEINRLKKGNEINIKHIKKQHKEIESLQKNLIKELFDECKSLNYNCSLNYLKINDFSVDIFQGFGQEYKQIFYTDGHLTSDEAIQEALDTLKNYMNHEPKN